MEKISIIVPVFNVAQWLPRCLESIRSQSFRDFRLYLIDDGSTDGSGKICEKFAQRDSRIQVLHQENRGVSAARNRGLDAAAGAYITFCDGDDFWEETHLEALYQAAEETGADMVSCNYSHVDEQANFLHRTAFPAAVRDLDSMEESLFYIQDVLSWRTGWAVWARLFRRKAMGNLRFCEDVAFGEDLLFVLEASLRCRRVVSVAGGGCCYRQHDRSATAGAGEKPMLDQRVTGAYRFWVCHPELGCARDKIAWALILPGLEAIPAESLHGALAALPQKIWVRDIARGIHSPQARFCVHKNVLRYRIERKLHLEGFPRGRLFGLCFYGGILSVREKRKNPKFP